MLSLILGLVVVRDCCNPANVDAEAVTARDGTVGDSWGGSRGSLHFEVK